ncbi:class I SAM-dependent DNA methyltransferase [Corynebacterium flavescens]|uniref:class I SAM-dependent DNA methyltransferase n=1 Tax=Corynebacterium flavescens TaxID=28028 RepID=UPI003FD31303
MTADLMTYVAQGNFRDLFQELGWDLPPAGVTPLEVETETGVLTVSPVADQSGLRVWVCTADKLPDNAAQRAVDAAVSKHSQVRLLIFTDGVHQSWRWPRRGATAATNTKLLHHSYTVGNPEQREDLSRRLAKIELPFDEVIGIAEIQDRMAQAFNDEAVKRSTEASRHMERMNQILLDAGCSTDTASSLLVRLLFLFFGDDTQMWPEDTFQKWVLHHTTADNFHAKLTELFEVLCDEELDLAQTAGGTGQAKGKYAGGEYQNFRRINGMYQEQVALPALPGDFRQHVLTAGEFDWGKVNPDIFGAMFQQLVDLDELRKNGEHYTSEENIQKVIEPLFLDEYRQRFQDAYNDRTKLLQLQEELAGLQFMDPACGSGNFLIQAYKHLRGLEYELITRAEELELEEIQAQLAEIEHQRMSKTKRTLIARRDELQAGTSLQFDEQVLRKSKLSMRQFYGIEINAWPAKVAATSMLLVDHLANQVWGENVVRLPIEETPEIVQGNALRTDWEQVVPNNGNSTYIFGNPPFLGDGREQDQLADLQHAWGGNKQISRLDYVTGWHALALRFFNRGRKGAFAYVTTNSIVQGDQTPRLFEPIFDAGWRISFAHRTFAWDSEALGKAAVHCVVVGFDRQTEPRPQLWDYPDIKGQPVEVPVDRAINAYLVDGPNVLVNKASKPISKEVKPSLRGSMPSDGGNLIVEPDEYDDFMADPITAKYVHRYIGARELLHGNDRWCLWLDGMDPADVDRSSLLKNRVEAVREFRLDSKASTTRDFAQFPHLFRQRAKQDVDFLCIPRHVSETRRYFTVARFSPDVIAGDANFTLPDPDGLQFGLMSSSMFITWQKTIGGRLESRLRFGSTLTWYTFPAPNLASATQKKIIRAGKGVELARELHPEQSLAEHYDPSTMDPTLVKAHDALDEEVDRAFGASGKLKNERERQKLLFAHYTKMTQK